MFHYYEEYKNYYMKINIEKSKCFIFDWDEITINTNLSKDLQYYDYMSDQKKIERQEAIDHFKKIIYKKVPQNFIKDAIDELEYNTFYYIYDNFCAYQVM